MSAVTKLRQDNIEGCILKYSFLRRMKRSDFSRISKFMVRDENGNWKQPDELDKQLELLDVMSEVLKDYLNQGTFSLVDSEGEQIEMQSVLEESFYTTILSKISVDFFEISFPEKDDEGNSKGSSQDSDEGSTSTMTQ